MSAQAQVEQRHDERRRDTRDRQARRTTRAGVIAKTLYVGVRLLSVPLAMHLLQAERYGLWLAVGSLVNWLGLFELGIGSGVVNALSAAEGRNDRAQARRHIATAVWSAAAMTVVGIAIALGLSQWGRLEQLLGVGGRGALAGEARLLVIIAGTCFSFSVLTNVLGQVWLGLQRGYLAQVAFMSGSVTGLLLLAVLSVRGGSLAEFALVTAVPPVAASLLLAAYFFGRQHPELRPGPAYFDLSSLKTIGGAGVFLSISQLGDLVILCSANLLIASHLGPAEVPRYAVAYSLLMFAQSVCLHFIVPLWPAYSEAIALGDWHYVRRTFRKSARTTLVLMAAGLAGFALLGRWFIGWWAGAAAVPSRGVVAVLCLWFLVWTWNQNVNVAVNAMGAVRRRALGSSLSALVFAGTALAMLPAIGLVAMPLSGLAGALAEGACTSPLLWRRLGA